MPSYKIKIEEKKSANYNIKAKNIAEAKELAYWRLHTQTRPSMQPTISYEMVRLSKNKPTDELWKRIRRAK